MKMKVLHILRISNASKPSSKIRFTTTCNGKMVMFH
jgi:hypothetical protein